LAVVGRRWQIIVIGTVLAFGAGAARAENLDAGKPAPALFAATCSACHAGPKGLARATSGRGLVDFLRQHYTASPESAGALAAYLMANPGDPRAKQAPAGGRAAASPPDATPGARRSPGQAAEPPAAKTERPPHQTATARPDSMVEPPDARRPHEARPEESAKGAGRGKRQQAKQQETPAPPPAQAAEPPAASAAPAAPVAAAPEPPPDQPAFSVPSP
jgi:hypothetical protein